MSEELILICKKCNAVWRIRPPKKHLKKTTTIELYCEDCGAINNYKFAYKLKKQRSDGILVDEFSRLFNKVKKLKEKRVE